MEGSFVLENCLQIKNINGFKGGLKNSLFYYKRESPQANLFIYPAGNKIVCAQLTTSFDYDKAQDPIFRLETRRGVTCITQSPSRRYLAWAEETGQLPFVVIEDLKTGKRRVVAAETHAHKYVSLCFNGSETQQPRTLVALTSGPQYCLVVFNSILTDKFKAETALIEKSEKEEAREQKYSAAFFFSKEGKDEEVVLVIGKGTVKQFKVGTEAVVKMKDSPFSKGKEPNQKLSFNCISYCQVGRELIIGTDAGELLYITASGEYKCTLNNSPSTSTVFNQAQAKIEVLATTSRGFLVGTEESTVLIYERPEVKGTQQYVRVDKKIQLREQVNKGVKVTSLLLTPKEEYLFVGLSNNQIYRVPFADKSYEEVERYQPAIQKFHSERVKGMDVCLRKPFVATCSIDRTVKIWNYSQKTNLEISTAPFEEVAVALTLHPSGLHLIVAFPDKIRLFNIFENEIIHFKEIPQKNSTDVKFSHGGHLFAIVNNVTVHVYRFYTGEEPKLHQINTLAQNTCICWEQDDQGMFVATAEGKILYYRFEEPQLKFQINKVFGVKITAMATVFNHIVQKQLQSYQRILYYSGEFDGTKGKEEKGIFESRISPKLEKDRDLTKDEKYVVTKTDFIVTETSISRIAFLNSGKLLLYTTCEKGQAGSLRYCRYPFSLGGGICEIACHSDIITGLSVTFDDLYVFTCGRDGLLVTYEVKEKEVKLKIDSSDPTQYFLIQKSNYMEKKEALEATRRKKLEENEKKIRKRLEENANFERAIQDLQAQIAEKNRVERMKYEREEVAIQFMQEQHRQTLRQLAEEKNRKHEAVRKDYQEKLRLEGDRLKDLRKTGENLERKCVENKEELRKKSIEELRSIEKEYQARLQAARRAVEAKHKEYEEQEKVFQKEEQELEGKLEREIENIKEDHEQNRKQLDGASQFAQVQNMTKKKDLDDSNAYLQQQKLNLKHMRESIKNAKKDHSELELKKVGLLKEIEEREKTIKDKLTRIHQLKKKTQQLQKFKFVLDYKIRELKRDVTPKEDEINKMNEQIDNMSSEIQHFLKTNEGMKLIVKDLRLKKQGMLDQIRLQSEHEQRLSAYIRSFESDLSTMLSDPAIYMDYKRLKTSMIGLYRTYVEVDDAKKKKSDSVDQQKEFMKERAYLQTNVKSLKEKFDKNRKAHKKDIKRMMSHNEELIYETNDLIREIKNIKDEQRRIQIDKNLQGERAKLERTITDLDRKIKEATEKLNTFEDARPAAQQPI